MTKRLLTMALLIGGIAASDAAAQEAERNILIEDFSSVTCVNCEEAGLIIKEVAEEHEDRIITIEYHLDIPGRRDPFYEANKPHNEARSTYYDDLNALPQVFIGGVPTSGTNESSVRGEVASQLTLGSPVDNISVTQVIDGGQETVKIEVTVGEGLPADYRLYAAVVEAFIEKTPAYFVDTVRSQPYEGQTQFHNVFRTFLTPAGGVEAELNAGVHTFDYTFTPGAAWQSDELFVIAWLQDEFSDEVLQVGWSQPLSGVRDVTSAAGFDLAAVAPNPARDHVEVSFTLGGPEEVDVILYDVQGREARRFALGAMEQGNYHRVLDLDGLSSGSYTLSLRAGAYHAVEQVQVVR